MQPAIQVRCAAGDDICSTLAAEVERLGLPGAAVVTAVGSYSEVVYALPGVREDGSFAYMDLTRMQGRFSLVSLTGHFGRDDKGEVRHHLHTSFACEDGQVLGGHLFSALVLVTAEISLQQTPPWRAIPRSRVGGEQAWALAPAEASSMAISSAPDTMSA